MVLFCTGCYGLGKQGTGGGGCLCYFESNEMYAWVMEQLEFVKPVYKLESTRFIFADQLITEELLTILDITEACILRADQFHLFNHVFPTFFGPTIWSSTLASLL